MISEEAILTLERVGCLSSNLSQTLRSANGPQPSRRDVATRSSFRRLVGSLSPLYLQVSLAGERLDRCPVEDPTSS